ncbi:hypothetical protein EDB85DRAFT_1898389 [Lactarius pseudohatsudake]|nr:hypothetical protein EDB85DRAFT_1898389 [Lactarius pseudohatsudake]
MALKLTDRSDMGHFHGLGASSNRGALLVLMEYRDRNQGRKRTRKWDAEGQGRAKTAQSHRVRGRSPYGQNHFWEQYRERLVETSPSSVTHFDERGAPLAPLNFSVSISGEQRHFPGGRHGLLDYGKLSQAHLLKLGRSGTGLIALALSPFVRKCAATDIPALYCFYARTSSPPLPPPPSLWQLSMGSPHAAPAHNADGSRDGATRRFRGRGRAAGWRRSAGVLAGAVRAGVANMERWFLDNAVNDIDRETRDRSSSVMTRMVSTRVNPFAGEVQLTCSRISCFPAPIYLSKEFDFPQHELSGEFGATDFGVGASVNSSAAAILASASPPGGSVESPLQASSFPSTAIAPPLSVAAAAHGPTHRMRHSVDAPVLALKDANALFRRDSSPDASSLDLGPSPGRVALRRDSARCGQGSATYVQRRSSPDDGGVGGDGDSLVPIPFPRVVSGEYGGAPSSSPFNSQSQSQSPSFDPVERAPSNERASSNVNSPSSLLPRGRFQSEVDGASSRRRPRPNSYDEFGAKPRRSRFESMVNLGVASGEQASASDLMARDATEGSVSRQTLVVREEGRAPTHFQLGNCIGRGQFGAVYRALNLNTGQMVAVKRIGLEGLKEEEISQLMREVDLVKRLSHPSIVKYEGMARDENTLSIVLEYAENGSLGQTLKAFSKLNEKLVASYVFKILEGLDYLHRSDVVHCDLKAANILTTKTGNVKLSDFGVSLNLRAMEREVKDVAGTPNWMAPEVIELKGASPKSDIWSLGCTVIELLTGRPPYGDIGNAMTVEDESPPIPERFSGPLVAFLKECFHKDPSMRPSAEQLFEHEWLKNHWGLNKDLRPQDSIPFLRRVSADLQKNGAARHLMANLELDSPIPVYAGQQFDGDMAMLSSSPGHRSFTGSASPVLPEVPQSEADLFEIREHTFVKTTFGKRASPTISGRESTDRNVAVNCRVCMEPAKKGAVLCSHCSLIAHSKCAGRAALTCDLRSKLLMHAHFAERGNSPAEFFTHLPNHHPASASSSRGSLDRDRDQRERERTNSPQLSPTSSPHPPIAYKVLSPFNKRSRASLTPDPTHSNSSVSLAGAAPPPHSHSQTKVTIPEGNIIRRKLSIILTRQREPQQAINTHLRDRPQSISSIGSSCANSPQSPASQSPQSNSLRSLQAVVAATGNSSSSSSASRAARVDPSATTTASSFVDAAADVEGASCLTVPDTAVPTVASRDKKRMMTMTRRARGDSSKASTGGNCSIQ